MQAPSGIEVLAARLAAVNASAATVAAVADDFGYARGALQDELAKALSAQPATSA